ncbi:hypothetical protein POM88_045068 [Heracleum sosnowskyi]|uniref:Uncharacterized protein n=1 Tax=Heracleum sosnowskyi TaxID=360622 RepID=A0AAD8H535_9APIA|nr:hypothetical protein POM88_045068 [Heracleum sosnowskyi]
MLLTMVILTPFKPFYLFPGPLMLLSLGDLPDNGALVCASTGGYSFPGSTPLHLAARGGSVDFIRELLAWGADRHQRDSSGRIPYTVALKYKHGACAALLNPSSAEPLVWPSPLKFISELNQQAKALLEQALMEANRELNHLIYEGRKPKWLGKTNFVEVRSFWKIFRSFDRMWSFLILSVSPGHQ